MKKAAVFFADGFEEIEAFTQVDLLKRAGIQTDMITINKEKKAVGAHNIKTECDMTIDEMEKDGYDALILPGGMPGTKYLGQCKELTDLLLKYNSEGKIVAAICAAPSVLGALGILKGKKACCYPGFETMLTGAEVVFEECVREENVITSRGAGTAIEFAYVIIEALMGKEKAKEIPIEGFNVPNKVLNKVGINLEILNQYLMQTFGETDKLLNEKLIKSFDILESREILKQKLKIVFFYIIMGLLIILTISPLIIVFVFCNNSNSYAFALSTIASVVELATGIIILPKIIARYLFNREEDNLYFELIRDLKDYHNSKRKDF